MKKFIGFFIFVSVVLVLTGYRLGITWNDVACYYYGLKIHSYKQQVL